MNLTGLVPPTIGNLSIDWGSPGKPIGGPGRGLIWRAPGTHDCQRTRIP
jgi:hypothetical protein